jgi:HD-GYP domain-containing protein (c-di-GMP phosphodiesterase class II)
MVAAAEVIKKSCRKKDIISRWGGDEFAIILNNADNGIAEEICARIKVGCVLTQIEPNALSIAVGYSIATPTKDIRITITEAEERMYRHKLFEDHSARSSLLTSLQRTLEEKSHETQEHTRRLRELCVKMGKRLQMDRAKIEELMLFALMHDIGKIGVPDDILNKPSGLTEEEWEIMKTHTSIGYRIASASPQLSHIAYAILTHHEHYNGGGYPKGLRGTRIPRISRILAIADAFDVMTHDRPYKTAISKHQAMEELQRCSGSQFDPDLVRLFLEILENSEKLVG